MTIKTSNIPGEFVLLAEDEVDEINAKYRKAQGDLVASWAKCSAQGAIIEELQKDLAEALAEIARLKPTPAAEEAK